MRPGVDHAIFTFWNFPSVALDTLKARAVEQYELLSRLTVSLAIGLLIGLERGWRGRDEEDHQRAAGFRTFALSGLLGGIVGAISLYAGSIVIGFVFAAYTAAFAAFHWLEAAVDRDVSATSVVAGMVTFLLGTLAVIGDLRIAIACAVIATILLALRDPIHRWVATLTWQEIRAVLILLAMSFLLLPFLPRRTIDPWGVINPYEIWLLAILIAATSFGGYVAIRALGDRYGVLLTAMMGGLASSTITTLTFARLGREHPDASRLLGAGILVSGVVMIIRVGVLTVALNEALLTKLAVPLFTLALILGLGSAVLLFGSKDHPTPALEITNPLAIGSALKFALLIATVMLAAQLLHWSLGDLGVLVVAGVSGLADVDAATISMARLGGNVVALETAAWAILIAVAVNTLTKAAMAAWVGGRTIGSGVIATSLGALTAAAIANWSIG
jgi:uncharacterized membrane protein (DUF4010 family)